MQQTAFVYDTTNTTMSGFSGKNLPIKARDVRWTQEFLYPSFSNGAINVAETYALLALGILDPASMSPMVIFQHDQKYWCRDTRRLMIAKALEAGDFPAFQDMRLILVNVGDGNYEGQYRNLIHERFPAMKKKKIDGTAIKISTRKGSTCCFDLEQQNFKKDLFQHIAVDHLKQSSGFLFQINSFYCDDCENETMLKVTRPSGKKSRKYYRISRQCQCDNGRVPRIDKPWQKVSLEQICYELQAYQNQGPRLRSCNRTSNSSRYETEVSSNDDTD